jgi:hypothetical protein
MSKRRQIARYAAAKAARAAYQAIMNAPLRKVATERGQKTVSPSKSQIAKVAGNAAYQSIMKLGQLTFDPDATLAKYELVEDAVYKINQGLEPEDRARLMQNQAAIQAQWNELKAELDASDDPNAATYKSGWGQSLAVIGVK